MNIEGLRYAQAVSQTKSFSAAARDYGVTQPALSNGVARLEEELGVKLFDRSPRGVKPTAHGARILPMIDQALGALDSITAEARRLARPATGAIRMGVSPLIGADLVACAFDAARSLSQPRDLVLREADLDLQRASLKAGELDVLLVPAVEAMPAYRHRVILSEPVVVIDPAADPAEGPVELGAAAGAAYILVPDTCGLTTFTTQLFHSNDLALRTYPGEAASYRVLDEWAGMGVGAALLPRSKVTHQHANCRPLVRSGAPVEISYEAVWARENPLAADLEEFVDALAEAAAPLEQVGADAHESASAPTGESESESE
ncbi:DNA-binding transcriptional regulator, LysR family [Streptomyces sp. cf386]|uniref:LysR family transcriptional regulator n=1 Tax=Streptomyces sp. cf386 TaxID=1761904 RepID=UPI0008921937|nr:LysR family transcriptional regulator [Streptomyces sp. cf386]SDO57813.1 DNA-binding transcriptional regulator, LysR family [Streptomyces sp. cf386]